MTLVVRERLNEPRNRRKDNGEGNWGAGRDKSARWAQLENPQSLSGNHLTSLGRSLYSKKQPSNTRTKIRNWGWSVHGREKVIGFRAISIESSNSLKSHYKEGGKRERLQRKKLNKEDRRS